MRIKRFFYRPLAVVFAVVFFLTAPLGSYLDARTGKIESEAFVIALPAAVTAYEVVQYVLIAIATSAGVYGIATADWDRLIWEFRYSFSGDITSPEIWADSILSDEYMFYDDGTLRNIYTDYAMADMVSSFQSAVGEVSPDYDLSDLPYFNPDKYDTIDTTAQIMNKYYQQLLERTEPFTTDKERMDLVVDLLRILVDSIKKELEEAGAHVPTDEEVESNKKDRPHGGKAQHDLNQAICDYFNYIVHCFEANSTFYNPNKGNGFNIHVGDTIANAWIAFLVSKGLVSETSDSVDAGVPVTYERYDAYSLYGFDNCVDISEFLFPGSKSENRQVYGLPWGFTEKTSLGVYSLPEPSESFVRDLNGYRVLSWLGKYSSYNALFNCCDSVLTFTWDGSKWRSGSFNSYQGVLAPDTCYIDFSGAYRTNYYTLSSDSPFFFSGNIKFIKDGVTYGLLDFVDKHPETGYVNTTKSVQDIVVQETGEIVIYTPDIATDIPDFITKVDAVAQSPTTDLADQKVQDLFNQVENIYTPSISVNPDIPVSPDTPIVPDVPVDPVDPGGSDTSNNPDMDGMKTPVGITDKFPFCVPFDLIDCVKVWNVPSKKPVFEVPFQVQSLGINETIVIDLTVFDSVTSLLRFLILLSYIVFLVILTRTIVKG